MVISGISSPQKLQSRFIGRDKELAWLKERYEKARQGEGSMSFISGEAGIGKTRLLEKLTEHIFSVGGISLRGACLYQENADPYFPVLDALKGYTKGGGGAGNSQDFAPVGLAGMDYDDEKSEDESDSYGGYDDSVPMGMIGMGSLGEIEEKSIDKGTVDLGQERDKMFSTLLQTLVGISKNKPLLLILDDLQWADSATLQLLHYIARNIATTRIMVCGLYRPEAIESRSHPLFEALKRMRPEKLFEEIKLDRLDKDGTKELMQAVLAMENISDDFAEKVFGHSEGNPFFIIEVLNSLVDEKLIDTTGYTWDVKVDLTKIRIPASIRDIIETRIDKMDEDSQRVIRYAAVIGDKVPFDVLLKATEMDEEDLVDCVDKLLEGKIFREDAISDDETYHFEHKMAREVVYNTLSRSRRRLMHKNVGEIMEAVYRNRPDDVIYSLAHHFNRGKSSEKAAHYAYLAGKKALSTYAIDEAINYYQNTLKALERLPESAEHLGKRAELLIRIGDLCNVTSEWNKAVEFYNQCREFCARTGDRKREAEAYCKIGLIKAENLSIWDEALEALEKALSISESIQDANGMANANRGLGYIHWRKGEHKEAEEHYNESIEYAKKAGDTHVMSITLIELGNVYNMIGELEKGRDLYIKSLEALEKISDFSQMARAYNNLGDVYLQTDEWDKAIEYFEKCRKASEKIGNVYMTGWSYFNAGEAYAKLFKFDEAKESLDRAYEILKNLGEKIGIAAIYQNYSIMYRLQKKWDEALKYLDDSRTTFEELDTPYELGKVYADYARLYRDKGEKDKARENYQKSLEYFEKSAASREIEKIKNEFEESLN